MPYYFAAGERVQIGKNLGRGTVTEDQKHDSNIVKVSPDNKPDGTVDGFYAHDLKPVPTDEAYEKGQRVLVDGFKFGTVYRSIDADTVTVPILLDRAKNTLINVNRRDVKPITAEQEAQLNIELNSPMVVELGTVEIPDGLMAVMFGSQFTGSGSIKDGKEESKPAEDEPFRLRIGDRVKFKYGKKVGTVRGDEMPGATRVHVEWDKEGKPRVEHVADLQVLHAPRETTNPNQLLIDQIEDLRRPLIIELEKTQAILSHLTKIKKILQKG